MLKLPVRIQLGVALVAILGSLLYYTLPVTRLGLGLVLTLAIIGAWLFPLYHSPKIASPKPKKALYGLAVVVLCALGAWWSAVLPIDIQDAMRSPWGVVPPFAVSAFGLAFFALLTMMTQPSHRLTVVLFIAALFSAVAMAATVYPLGLGFDPFLHRATMAHIAEFGTIVPKPLYYIGQYALELTLHMLFGLPLSFVDRWLLPLFAAITLTGSALYNLPRLTKNSGIFAISALLLLPLGSFIATTPQGVAYVFSASAVLFSFARLHDHKASLGLPILLSVAALLTHPFAGIPALMYTVAFAVIAKLPNKNWQTAGVVTATLAGMVAIPAMFALQASRSGLSLAVHVGNLFDLSRWRDLALSGFFSNHYSLAYDALYLVVENLLWLTIIASIIGGVTLWREKQSRHLVILAPLFALAMLSNFVALSIIFDFDFLIAYERSDYALRSLMMAQIFLLPFTGVGLAEIENVLRSKPQVLRTSFIVLLAIIGMGNVYGAYPRHDNYSRSAGFNVSQADFDAVDAIDDKASGEDYIVLANQATAAAAVESAGFKKYYHGDIFYYPIPTGGVMYDYFLTMVNVTPTRETMITAMDTAGVDLGFFAVSDYWWKSEVLVENAKRSADDWFSVDNGKVTVFIYRR